MAVFQTNYGSPPGSQDAKADCEKWERLCDELLVERARLRAALEKECLDRMWREFKPTLTMEEVYAQVDRETSLEQIVLDLKNEVEAAK